MPLLNRTFWENEKLQLLAVIKPRLEQMAFSAAQQAAAKAGIAFNPALANSAAAQWARNYTDALLAQLGTTSEAGVGALVSKWIETPDATYGKLQNDLMQFGAARAQSIAVTETTRAYAEGELMSYKQEGITQIRWNTNRDELVCPLCGPLNGKIIQIGKKFGTFNGKDVFNPPYHPNCRCWISPISDIHYSNFKAEVSKV